VRNLELWARNQESGGSSLPSSLRSLRLPGARFPLAGAGSGEIEAPHIKDFMMQSHALDVIETEAVSLSSTEFPGLREVPRRGSRIGKKCARKTRIALKIHGLAKTGAQIAKN
jgi:hypothetical protein